MQSVVSLTNLFNHFLSIIVLFLWSLLPPLTPVPRLIIPSQKLEQAASTSAVISVKSLTAQPLTLTAPVPWGSTEKIGDHLYRTYVGSDPVMGSPEEILSALNVYRKSHGTGPVRTDENICKLALSRAQEQQKAGNLDGHKGLSDYMSDPKHWENLDVTAIGENASFGYVLSGTHLIEWVFDSDVEHRDNQLNPQWNLACAGVSGLTVDIIFGKR